MNNESDPQNNNPLSGISKYWQVIAGVLVAALAVGGYVEKQKDIEADTLSKDNKYELRFKNQETKIEEIKEQVYKELEQRVDDLEEDKAYKDGYQQALKDMKNDK